MTPLDWQIAGYSAVLILVGFVAGLLAALTLCLRRRSADRDRFAAAALVGLLTGREQHYTPNHAAVQAYAYAESMLAEKMQMELIAREEDERGAQ